MKHWLSRCVAVAVLVSVVSFGASAAFAAAGLNLGWGAFCPTNVASQADQTDPCDGSTGATYQLIGTTQSPIALPLCQAEEISLDLQEAAATLSDYWRLEDENQPGQVNPAGCRGTNSIDNNIGSLSVAAGTSAFPTTFTGCLKIWGASPAGGVNYLPGIGGPNRARLDQKWSKSPSSSMAAAPSQYGSFSALIDTNHQLAGADPNYPPPNYLCLGCLDGVCIVYNQCVLRQEIGAAGGDVTITNQDVRRIVTWQGGGSQDCNLVPVKRTTWGHLKSLYR